MTITFRQPHKFIKKHQQFVYNKDFPEPGRLCEICKNAVYVANSLNNYRKGGIPSNSHDFGEKYSSDFNNRESMFGDWDICFVALNTKYFNDSVKDCDNEDLISVFQWK